MDMSLLVWWLIAGWCGTPPRRPKVPTPPFPQVLMVIAAGLIGGLLGGWLFTAVWPLTEASAGGIYAAVSGLPALAGGRVLSDILGLGIRALGPQPIPPEHE